MRALPQWVLSEEGTKRPLSVDGSPASTTDPTTWGSCEEISEALRNDRIDGGLGFVFTRNDPYAGIDLDRCRDADTGKIDSWAMEIVASLNSYTEASISGTGLHVIVRAKLPGNRNRKGNTELYDTGRYFIVTGQHIDGTPTTIEDETVPSVVEG